MHIFLFGNSSNWSNSFAVTLTMDFDVRQNSYHKIKLGKTTDNHTKPPPSKSQRPFPYNLDISPHQEALENLRKSSFPVAAGGGATNATHFGWRGASTLQKLPSLDGGVSAAFAVFVTGEVKLDASRATP